MVLLGVRNFIFVGHIDMKVKCKMGLIDCNTESDIEKIIMECATGGDKIWMYEVRDDEHPRLSIHINKEKAIVCYFSIEPFGSYQSVGNGNANDTTEFLTNGEMWIAPNDTVVPLLSAVECAKQFFITKKRPSCIEWSEL